MVKRFLLDIIFELYPEKWTRNIEEYRSVDTNYVKAKKVDTPLYEPK